MRGPALSVVGALFASPALFVLWRAATADRATSAGLADLAAPTWRTVQLAVLVSSSSMVLGTALAWLLVRTDLAARRVWRVVLMLPLVLPSFVGATAFLAGFARGGMLHAAFGAVGIDPPRRIRGLGPAWLLLTAFSYPFVMMPVSARLQVLRPSLIESARLLGASSWEAFIRITVPHCRAAMVGGGLIVFLYCLSEFGVVQLLGYDTLTRVVYATRQVDRPTSFAAATAVLLMALAVVVASSRLAGEATPDATTAMGRAPSVRLGRWHVPALAGCVAVAAIGVVAPVASLAGWAARGLADDRVDVADLLGPAGSSAAMGVIAAFAAVCVVAPVASSVVRRPSLLGTAAGASIVAGFALPGIVIALALAVLTLNAPLLDVLYQTAPVLVLAYVVHFGGQAYGSARDAARAVSPAVRDSARLLEPSRWRRLLAVDLPLMRPGLVAGGGLVMLATLKELPATLLLAPIGFRTLATEVWGSFEEGFYADAALASLALLVVSGVLSWWLVVRRAVASG